MLGRETWINAKVAMRRYIELALSYVALKLAEDELESARASIEYAAVKLAIAHHNARVREKELGEAQTRYEDAKLSLRFHNPEQVER
jgi:hypothetical protein